MYVRIPQYTYDILVSERVAGTGLLFCHDYQQKNHYFINMSALQHNSMQRRQIPIVLIVRMEVLIVRTVSFKNIY